MPELPEVETIVRGLRAGRNGTPPLKGKRIERAEVHWPGHISTPSAAAFKRKIRGRLFERIRRRGKYLVFELDRGTLLIHLKMTGDLQLTHSDEPRGDYDHTVFLLENDWELRFSDARKFGRVYLVDQPEIVLDRLGPEPLDESFTVDKLRTRLNGRSRALKGLLLDQGFIAGVGNIYADEALHRAGLHPLQPANSLANEQIHDLWRGIREALQAGIHANGASIDWVYRGGSFQNEFRVYGRHGEPCPVCRTPIERIVVAQRGTHYCPSCQPEPNLP